MSGWATASVRRVFKIVNGGTPTSDSDNWDGDVQWATPVDLGSRDGRTIATTARTLTEVGLRSGSADVPSGSLIVSTRAPIGYVAQTAAPMAFNQGCKGLTPSRPVDARYYRFVFASLKAELQARGQGSTFVELSADGLGSLAIPLPPLPTQRTIADYLDTETARIDALIEKKRRMVELLGSHLRSFISEAASDGPLVQVRRITSLRTSGPRGWGDRVTDEGRPFIRSANLQRNGVTIRTDNLAYVDVVVSPESLRSTTKPGDVLIGITGANTGWVGHVPRDLAGGFVSQHVAMIRPDSVDSKWLAYAIFSFRSQDQLLGGQYGGTKQQLGLDDLADLRVSAPSLQVQEERVKIMDAEWSRVERLVTLLGDQIDLLAVRRQALITATVTGKLTVPGVAA